MREFSALLGREKGDHFPQKLMYTSFFLVIFVFCFEILEKPQYFAIWGHLTQIRKKDFLERLDFRIYVFKALSVIDRRMDEHTDEHTDGRTCNRVKNVTKQCYILVNV